MSVLKVLKQIKDSKFTYSLMGIDSPKYVHINNHVDNENAVMVPVDTINELIGHQAEMAQLKSLLKLSEAKHDRLVDENAGLKAQVELLHEARKEWKGLACNDGITLESIIRILYKTPRQCLASVKADAIDELLGYSVVARDISVRTKIKQHANKIREAANEG